MILLQLLGLKTGFIICQISYPEGSSRQRVAIARALVNRPEIIFADEPTGNLDSNSDEVIALLKMTAKKYGQTIVMITHDDEIAQVADRILVIEDGQVVDFR